MNGLNSLVPLIATLLATASAQPADAPSDPPFRSIELRGGGVVSLSHGPIRRVTVIEGSGERRIRTDGDRLVIDECRRPCPEGHRIKVDVIAPEVASLRVSNGGLIRVESTFPTQPTLSVAVDNGGSIDARALEPARVEAGVSSGGRILVNPGQEMDAAIVDGGVIFFWGNPRVRSSVRRGGEVAPGDPAYLRRPIDMRDPAVPSLPAALRH